MSAGTDGGTAAGSPLWSLGAVEAGFAAVLPTLGDGPVAAELATSNQAALAYSDQLLRQLIGGFAVPAPGVLAACGRSPAPQTVGPAALERLLLHVPIELRDSALGAPRTLRCSSAAELVGHLDAGSALSTDAFGEQIPFARRLREHLARVTRRTATLELVVLGRGATWTVDVEVGGAVLVDGAVDQQSQVEADAVPEQLALGGAIAWNEIGPLRLQGRSRWNAVVVVRLGPELRATELAAWEPISSGAIVSLLAEERFRAGGPAARADLFVRTIAPGGLVVSDPDADSFAIAGHRYGATRAAVRALATVHAGPTLSIAALDRLLESVDDTDEFCRVATADGWLEYCHKGDLLT